MTKAYDHTDALSSPMLEPVRLIPDPFAGLGAGDLTHVPRDYVAAPRPLLRPAAPVAYDNPHTRIGY